MALLKLELEIKKELRDTDSWLSQIGNIAYALVWSLVTWLSVSTITLGLFISILIATDSLDSTFSASEFKSVMICAYVVSGLLVILFGVPKKVRNVFKESAQYRVNRQKEIYGHADLVESVLIRHKLIIEADAAQAKSERESK